MSGSTAVGGDAGRAGQAGRGGGVGRVAKLPDRGWRPGQRRQGCVVWFVSEDGTQRHRFDLSNLPGGPVIKEELAAAFEAVTGPLGSYKRFESAKNLPHVARRLAAWIAQTRPGLTELGQLTRADARMLARSIRTVQERSTLRALLRHSTASSAVIEEIGHYRIRREHTARQPYTDAELARICTVARAIVRRARDRIWQQRTLVTDYRSGRLAHLDATDPTRCLAEVLDHYDRLGDVPWKRDDQRMRRAARAVRALQDPPRNRNDESVMMSQLHLTNDEAWAFAVLLAALTGLNLSVLDTLPAPRIQATGDDEPPVALVDTVKHRRGPRACVTLPLDAFLEAMPAAARSRVASEAASRVGATSLTSAFGVFSLLIDLSEPARRQLRTERALVYVSPVKDLVTGSNFKVGVPGHKGRRRGFVKRWLTGDGPADALLTGISFDRLRKTRIAATRRPIAHTPATYASYLSRMSAVTTEGFQIIREALDQEVAKAADRRKMQVITASPAGSDPAGGPDTILGSCSDFEHSPIDGGLPCRQTFLTCLECENARALPRHLPFQLAVHDKLTKLRTTMAAAQWATDYAGPAAQLQQIITEFGPAQVHQARSQITEAHRRWVDYLFQGDLDPQ